MTVRSHLARHQPVSFWDEDEIERAKARAWHEKGLLVVDPENLPPCVSGLEWLAQALRNLGTELYGQRRGA